MPGGFNMDKEINTKLDYFLIGEKVTNYQMPIIVESIKDYNGIAVMYTRNIKGRQLAFEVNSLVTAFENYNNNRKKNND